MSRSNQKKVPENIKMREFPSMGNSTGRKDRVAVILAGGEGSRLKSLTRMIAGDERPKQFCPILGNRTLLDATRERISKKFDVDKIYFSLTRKHERFYERPLWDVRAGQKVVQPENKGTAPAILYSLMRIAQYSPEATVSFFPSDHYCANDEEFMANVELSISAAELSPDSIVLLGIEPEKPETSYGWIEPADTFFGDMPGSISRVKRFWEKPSRGVAQKLLQAGCLWNSFVMTGKVMTFLDMFRKHLPDMFRMFAGSSQLFGTSRETAVIRSAYAWIHETNFSTEVLERSASDLLVMRVGDVGWSDWGEPQRVMGTLTGLGINADWMSSIAA
jgi:mannose-1-phosphate guanylyltransferase